MSAEAPVRAARRDVPGALLVRSAPAGAWLVIAFNAFVLQRHWPGRVSGILGDLATCFLFPVLLVASVEWLTWALARLRRRPWAPAGRGVQGACCLVAAGYYAGLELAPPLVAFHGRAMEWLTGLPVTVTPDPWDLLALPVVLVAWRWLRDVDREAEKGLPLSWIPPLS